MRERMAGTQHAAAMRVAVSKVNLDGAGITYILLAEPPRMGENGPMSVEHVREQLEVKSNLFGSGEIGAPLSS